MNALHTATIRLAAALAACATTLVLFQAVVSISEPQRSELLAAQAARTAIATAASASMVAQAR